MLHLSDEDIGGARVRRSFTFGDRHMKPGDELTGAEVLSMPVANRRALIDTQYFDLRPRSNMSDEEAERFMVHVGQGRFHVVEGRKLTDEPISKTEAEALARE